MPGPEDERRQRRREQDRARRERERQEKEALRQAADAAITHMRTNRPGRILSPNNFLEAEEFDIQRGGHASTVLDEMLLNYIRFQDNPERTALANVCLPYNAWKEMQLMGFDTVEQVDAAINRFPSMLQGLPKRVLAGTKRELEVWQGLPETDPQDLVVNPSLAARKLQRNMDFVLQHLPQPNDTQ